MMFVDDPRPTDDFDHCARDMRLLERQDAVAFLRRQAAACYTPERIAALHDAASALERGSHVGAAEDKR
jgi:hypothetical protein